MILCHPYTLCLSVLLDGLSLVNEDGGLRVFFPRNSFVTNTTLTHTNCPRVESAGELEMTTLFAMVATYRLAKYHGITMVILGSYWPVLHLVVTVVAAVTVMVV